MYQPLQNLAISKIQEIEPSFKLHPVDPAERNQTILHAVSDFPKNLTDLKVFFKNARPIMKGGQLYMKVLASFDGEADQMIPKVSWYHRDRKERIAICAIQAFEVALSGWLLYSLRAMDTTLSTDTLTKMVGRPVSLQWMRILDGSRWDPDRDTSKDPQALHVESALDDKEEVRRCLHFLYGSKAKKFPLRIRMRIIPVIQSFVDLNTLAKCTNLRNRQQGWITQHVAKTTYDIINLDKKDTEIGKSLQNLLMDIPSSTGNKFSRYSFQSISPGKVAATHFHFIPIKTTKQV
jgi:hypothetical protein